MTARKRELALPGRTPAYVDRETGAAELCISPETWDAWAARKILPAAAPGFPESSPRWRWKDVDRKLSGKAGGDAEGDPYMTGAKIFGHHGSKAEKQRTPS